MIQGRQSSNRLKVYYDATAPVKEYYDKLGLIKEINGIGEVEMINEVILSSLKKN